MTCAICRRCCALCSLLPDLRDVELLRLPVRVKARDLSLTCPGQLHRSDLTDLRPTFQLKHACRASKYIYKWHPVATSCGHSGTLSALLHTLSQYLTIPEHCASICCSSRQLNDPCSGKLQPADLGELHSLLSRVPDPQKSSLNLPRSQHHRSGTLSLTLNCRKKL